MQISIADFWLETLLSRLYELAAQFNIMPDIPLETSMLLNALPILLDETSAALQKAVLLYEYDYDDGVIKETIEVYDPGLPSAFHSYKDLYRAAADSLTMEWDDTYEYLSDPDNLCELVPQAYRRIVREYFKELSCQGSCGVVGYYKLRFLLPPCPDVVDCFYDYAVDIDKFFEQMKDFIAELLALLTDALEELGGGRDIDTIRTSLHDKTYDLYEKYTDTDMIDTMVMLQSAPTHIYDLHYKLGFEDILTNAEEIAGAVFDCAFSFLADLVQNLVEWKNDANWFVKEYNLCYKAMNELCEVVKEQFNAISEWAEDEESWRDFVEENSPEYYHEIYGATEDSACLATASATQEILRETY